MADVKSSRIVIIGAGVGGISTAIALKRKYGLLFDDFTIYEKASDVGGTWRENIYPGCYSDVAIDFYSHSKHISPSWPESYGSQPVIQEYWKSLTTQYSLRDNIVFGATVVSARWKQAEQEYDIDILVGKNQETTTITAKILVSAVGVLEVPNDKPSIAGLETFKGVKWHSARWRKDVELGGKKVGVIGNGASATQFMPIITNADPSTEIVQFVRTPGWLFPPVISRVSRPTMWLKAHVPLVARTIRLAKFFLHETLWALFWFSAFRRFGEIVLTKYMLAVSPAKYHDKLIPSFRLGCKRILFNTGYLQALGAPNLTLNHVGIKEIVEDGIIDNDDKFIPLDVLILATGFVTNIMPVKITNAKGTSVSDYYDSKGGAQAYLGTMIPGFPNLFILSGPNVATGHTSVIFSEEIQINLMLQLVSSILTPSNSNPTTSVSASDVATDRYNASLQSYLSNTVWTGCTSWYRAQGKAGKDVEVGEEQKVSAIFPGPAFMWWWLLRKPQWKDYELTRRGGAGVLETRTGVEKKRFCTLLMVGVCIVMVVVWLEGVARYFGYGLDSYY